jgi:hypothetical protein
MGEAMDYWGARIQQEDIMSVFLTKELVNEAMEMVEPSIVWTLENVAKRFAGHLRVSALVDGEWVTLATRDFGEPSEWEYDYEGVATSKECISQRTGLPSAEVQALHPELVESGDTVYFGSVVSDGKTIVVSFSGVEAYYDEMFSGWTLAAVLAVLKAAMAEQRQSGAERFLAAT